MKTASIILSSASALMMLSQLTCGLWLKSHGADPSSISFHVTFGMTTAGVILITIVTMLVFVLKRA
jgi:hypothetical protein